MGNYKLKMCTASFCLVILIMVMVTLNTCSASMYFNNGKQLVPLPWGRDSPSVDLYLEEDKPHPTKIRFIPSPNHKLYHHDHHHPFGSEDNNNGSGEELYLEEEPPTKLKFIPSASSGIKFYRPLTSKEKQELYWKLLVSKRYQKSVKYLGGKLNSFNLKLIQGGKCCGGRNEWIGNYGGAGKYQSYYDDKLIKPVYRPEYRYTTTATTTTNQHEKYRNSDVKPVVEHIEGDLKYDFRTNTHSL